MTCSRRAPTTPSASSPPCTSAPGRAAAARAGRRSRPSRRRRARPGGPCSRTTEWRQPMTELPEVETIKRDLEKEVVGRRIKQVDVSGMRSIRRHPNKKHFAAKLEGRKLTGVERRGKYLLVRLEGGDVLAIHLGMSGQLLRAKSGGR